MATAANGDEVIVVDQLRKHYGATKAVDGVSFSVHHGEVFGMLGPNGAGKSTTIEMIEGLRPADGGRIAVLGLEQPKHRQAIIERIGIQLQTTALYPRHTVVELIDLFKAFYPGRQTVPTDELIDLVDLGEKRATQSRNLSGGQKQRLSLALALANDPDIIFLDEPTTGMDPQGRRQLWDVVLALKGRGKTILMTTHYMEEAQQLCDRVAVVDHGHIIELGSPTALIHRYFNDIAIEFDDPRTDLANLTALPGVTHASREEQRVTLYSADVPRTMAALLANERDGTLRDLNVHSATLEDVFLKLTGRALRD